jgi:hypothetical protein|tara:strand:+ start:1716 stop:1934 length:219 start_codon:yes stop_codon:yes gene_type:complete
MSDDAPKVVLHDQEYLVEDMDDMGKYLYDQTMDLISKKADQEQKIAKAKFELDQTMVALEGMQNKLQDLLIK